MILPTILPKNGWKGCDQQVSPQRSFQYYFCFVPVGHLVIRILATIAPMSHTCYQTPPMAWKPHAVNVWSMLPWVARMQARPLPQHLYSILIPFRFPAFQQPPLHLLVCLLLLSMALHEEYFTLRVSLPPLLHTPDTAVPILPPLGPWIPRKTCSSSWSSCMHTRATRGFPVDALCHARWGDRKQCVSAKRGPWITNNGAGV